MMQRLKAALWPKQAGSPTWRRRMILGVGALFAGGLALVGQMPALADDDDGWDDDGYSGCYYGCYYPGYYGGYYGDDDGYYGDDDWDDDWDDDDWSDDDWDD